MKKFISLFIIFISAVLAGAILLDENCKSNQFENCNVTEDNYNEIKFGMNKDEVLKKLSPLFNDSLSSNNCDYEITWLKYFQPISKIDKYGVIKICFNNNKVSKKTWALGKVAL